MRGITIREPIKDGIYKMSVSKLIGSIFERKAVSWAIGESTPDKSFVSW
jgi:hypothetical protein